MNIHAQRRLKSESTQRLAFRHEARRAFRNIDITPQVDSRLHVTLAAGVVKSDRSIQDIADSIRNIYDPPIEITRSKIGVVGRRLGHYTIALIAEENQRLQDEHEHFQRQLIGSSHKLLPHVSLMGVRGERPHKELLEWVAQRSPATLALGGISLSLTATPPSARIARPVA